MNPSSNWSDTAQTVVNKALQNGPIQQTDHQAIIAALALYRRIDSVGHPSYCNTAFAIAANLPESAIEKVEMQRLAFNLLTNGIAGYFQFTTRNFGKYSVWDALVYQGVIQKEETEQSFLGRCTHTGCGYYYVTKDLLSRICAKWDLPLLNTRFGGKPERTITEIHFLEYLIKQYPGNGASEKESVQNAIDCLSTGR